MIALSQIVTLKQNSDFQRSYHRGRSVSHPALVTYAVNNRAGGIRIGITASKKLGNAVERNRCRRVIRAAYAALAPRCTGSYDLVFVARFKTKALKSTDIYTVMLAQLKELQVIR